MPSAWPNKLPERNADALADDVQKAWEAWSRGIAKVDARWLVFAIHPTLSEV